MSTYGTGQGRANEANSGLSSVDTYSTGDNFTAGFNNGMGSGSSAASIWSTAWNLGKSALSALKSAIQEGSPSKLTYKSGDFFVQGFANAIGDGARLAVDAAKDMGEKALSALNEELDTGVNVPPLRTQMTATRNAIKNTPTATGSNGGTQVTNNYNFYQTNNSPKALSRLEIYRQTKNQLNFAKGV